MHDYWVRGIDLDEPTALLDCGQRAGLPHDTLRNALEDPAASALLRAEVDAAIRQGVFGSPFFSVDGEPFFGVDKLELIDEWLTRGGW